ncbi:MAG: pyrroline-5-carboxylate reductase [Pseudomonadota bacterium]
MSKTLLLVGCGNMGFAMLGGWLSADPDLSVHVVEPAEPLRTRAAGLGAHTVADMGALPDALAPELIILAVKPQVMADVVPAYARFAGGPSTFVSVAAGTTIGTLATMLPGPTPIIRCMPNTPAAIGHGMMVCCSNAATSEEARDLTTRLMATSGLVDWIEDEGLMDAVTALSGSGPAYIFHMIECMTAAGVSVGLPEDLAARMAMQTVMGAGRLAATADDPPGQLRQNVTSPGGTTAAALGVLMGEDRLKALMTDAVRAARDRGTELAAG